MSIPVLMAVFFSLLFLGMPIGFVMAITGFAYFAASGNPVFFMAMPEKIYNGINVFVLMALPFFMLAGELMEKSGVSDRLIRFSNILIGRVRGGLAQVNVLASVLFAGITGVALGDVVALGTVFVPTMVREGYDRKFSAAVTAASSILGPIIPPSLIIVLYGAVMQVSVGAMFVGAVIPGLLIGLSDMIIVHFLSVKRQYPKKTVRVTPAEFFLSFKDALVAMVMPLVIIGGILGGVFTPTEAAAVAVVYGLFVGLFVFRTLTFPMIVEALRNTVINCSKLFFILGGVAIITWIFGFENIPKMVETMFRSISTDKHVLLLLINLFFLFLGTWLDVGAMILLFVPVIAPLATSLGVNPIQFGIMIVVNCCIGLVTPPVGVVLFAISDIAKIDIMEVGKELVPFILINIFVVLMVAYIPELSLFLPRLFGFLN